MIAIIGKISLLVLPERQIALGDIVRENHSRIEGRIDVVLNELQVGSDFSATLVTAFAGLTSARVLIA